MKKNIVKSFLRLVFSIENTVTHRLVRFCGIKLRLPKYNKIISVISEICARETYSALEVSKLHTKVFPQFRHCNIDKNVTIIGCGPTVKYYNNEANFVNIALNKAILLDNIDYDYIFSFDSNILKTCPNFIDLIKQSKATKFIGKFLHPEFEYNLPEIKDEEKYNIYRYYAAKRHAFPSCKQFEYEIHQDISTYPLADFYSISFAALHFALYTYPQKIYLVGLDSVQAGNFFDGATSYNTKKIREGYAKFKEFAKMYYPETEIISINPVGIKGLFKDVYTQSYVDEHPELKKEEIDIIK